jgi:hypothetical protein
MSMTSEQRELLETQYLIALMKADARAYRKRIAWNEQVAPEPNRATILEMSRVKRVMRVRRGEEA